jgi:hypothetical protein
MSEAEAAPTAEFVPFFEGPLQQMRELERQLHAQDIDAELAKPPAKACCGGSCGCSSKLQLLVRKEDVPRVAQLMQAEWVAAVEREGGLEHLVQLNTPVAEGAEPPCPACGFVGPLKEGACGDCGLQLE